MADVPMREMKVYQTDDGRRVEVFEKIDVVKYDPGDSEEAERSFSPDKQLFIGAVHVMTQQGPKEIKFSIEATDIKNAFDKFHTAANAAVAELERRFKKAMEEERSHIQTVPAGALNLLKANEPGEEDGEPKLIL
jgi:hypothetical protein